VQAAAGTSKGGTIRITNAGYDDEIVSIGTHFDEFAAGGRAVSLAANPDPLSLAIEGFFNLIDAKGQYRKLDTRRIDVAMQPARSVPPREVPLASATVAAVAAAPASGGEVRRLTAEQIEAIVGPPLPSEAKAVTASSSPPRWFR
jgi:hypothetical protein